MSKPQSKTEKKIDSNLRRALTAVCEQTLKDVPGFKWLTHQADYSNFPASLLVTCVFNSDRDWSNGSEAGHLQTIRKRIQAKLLKTGVVLKKLEQQVIFDSEEACDRDHDGDWPRRLAGRAERAVMKNRPK